MLWRQEESALGHTVNSILLRSPLCEVHCRVKNLEGEDETNRRPLEQPRNVVAKAGGGGVGSSFISPSGCSVDGKGKQKPVHPSVLNKLIFSDYNKALCLVIRTGRFTEQTGYHPSWGLLSNGENWNKMITNYKD